MRDSKPIIIAFGLGLTVAAAAFGGWYWGSRAGRQDAAQALTAQAVTDQGGSGLPRRSLPGEPLLTPLEEQQQSDAQRAARQKETGALVAAGKRNLQAEYSGQPVNAAWARAKENELERLVVDPQMEAINAIPTSFDVECRSTACRIVADFPNRGSADDWLTLYLTTNGGLLPRVSFNQVAQADGSVRLEVLGSTK